MRILYVRERRRGIAIVAIDDDIIEALGGISGVELDVLDITEAAEAQNTHAIECFKDRIIESIKTRRPDLAMGYGFIGVMQVGERSHLFEKLAIPYAALCFDSPFYSSNLWFCGDKRQVFIFLHDRGYFAPLKRLGFENIQYFPIGTSMHLKLKNSRPPPCAVFDEPMAYVGSLNDVAPALNTIRMLQGAELKFANFAREAVLKGKSRDQLELLSAFRRENPELGKCMDQNTKEFQNIWHTLDILLTALLRLGSVKLAAKFGIRVFGSGCWRNALSGTGGAALDDRIFDYHTETPWIYKQAKMILVRTALNLQDAIQQRCLDVAAVGGFPLVDDNPALNRHFDVGREIATYPALSTTALQAKAEYFLLHEDERAGIAEKLQAKVLAEHTWRKRMEDFVEFWRKHDCGGKGRVDTGVSHAMV